MSRDPRPTAALAVLAVTALALLVTAPATAATWTVNCNPATFPDALTVNGGIALAADGDTIVVETCLIFPFAYPESVAIATRTGLDLVAADAGSFGSAIEGVGAGLAGAWPVVINAAGLGNCLSITSSTDIHVEGFSMVQCAGVGALVDSSAQVTLENNRVDRSGLEGILDTGGSGTRIAGNVVTRSGMTGIQLKECAGCLVNDNRVLRLGGDGIALDLSDLSRVTNNEIRQAAADGIHVISGAGQRLYRNTVAMSGGADILIDVLAVDSDIVGNDVTAAPVDLGTGTDAANNF